MKEQFLTPTQVAEMLQLNERTIYRWINSGKLDAIKLGRVWRISEKYLKNFLEECKKVN